MSSVFVLNLPSPTPMVAQTMEGYVQAPFVSIPRSKTHLVHSTGFPLGLFSDYSNHGTEFSVKVREKEHNWVEIFTPDDRLYMSMIGRDKKFLFDSQGSAILNVRNRALNFGGEYQVSQPTRSCVLWHQPQFSDQPRAGIRRRRRQAASIHSP